MRVSGWGWHARAIAQGGGGGGYGGAASCEVGFSMLGRCSVVAVSCSSLCGLRLRLATNMCVPHAVTSGSLGCYLRFPLLLLVVPSQSRLWELHAISFHRFCSNSSAYRS